MYGTQYLFGPRPRCVKHMPAGGAEPEGFQVPLRDFSGVNLREPAGPHASLAKLREQLPQTGSTILDERAQRHNLRPRLSGHRVKEVGLDSLIRGDGESCDVVLPCGERLDRPLPASRRMSLAK